MAQFGQRTCLGNRKSKVRILLLRLISFVWRGAWIAPLFLCFFANALIYYRRSFPGNLRSPRAEENLRVFPLSCDAHARKKKEQSFFFSYSRKQPKLFCPSDCIAHIKILFSKNKEAQGLPLKASFLRTEDRLDLPPNRRSQMDLRNHPPVLLGYPLLLLEQAQVPVLMLLPSLTDVLL